MIPYLADLRLLELELVGGLEVERNFEASVEHLAIPKVR